MSAVSRESRRKSKIAVVLLMFFGVGTALPVLAQTKADVRFQENESAVITSERDTTSVAVLTDTHSDLDRSIAQFIDTETSHLSYAEKQALHTLLQLELKDSALVALSSLSDADTTQFEKQLETQLKNNPKLNNLSSGMASLKFSPAVFAAARLAGYLRSIGKAVLFGNAVGAIRTAEFDFPAMFSALSSGDTQEFTSLLSEALPRQTTFVSAVSTGANFACNTATIDLTPGLCDRFTGFMRSTIVRYQRSPSPNSSTVRSRTNEVVQSHRQSRYFWLLQPISTTEHSPLRYRG